MIQDPDNPYSRAVVEDLDPEPPARQRHTQCRELIIGLVLVLGLAGLGGWQWWQQQSKLGAYQAGGRAAAAQDWDAAYAAYSTAGDYSDAPTRAAAAGHTIAERSAQYQRAADAAADGNWPVALQAIRQVQQIAPHFWATDDIARQAQQEVYALALSGTVALRPQADPPGLYAYTPDGWRWLQGSDAQSRVRATCPNGDILFDAPRAGSTPTPAPRLPVPPAPLFRLRPEERVARQLLESLPDGAPGPHSALGFDPGAFSYYCAAAGFWTADLSQTALNGLPPGLVPAAPFHWIYQPFDDYLVSPAPPGSAWVMLTLTLDGRHVLLLDGENVTPQNLHARLYVADPDGGNRRALADLPGGVRAAQFSADGRYLLLTLHDPARDTVWLLDTSGDGDARMLVAEARVSPSTPAGAAYATFLNAGAHAGQGLVLWNDGESAHVRLFDPAAPDPPLAEITLASASLYSYLVSNSLVGPDVVLAVHPPSAEAGGSPGPLLVYLDAANKAHVMDARLDAGSFLERAWVREGRLIYTTVEAADSSNAPTPFSVRSVSLSAMDSPTARPGEIFSGTVQIPAVLADRLGEIPPTTRLGPGLLAYTTPGGELHARTYDGAVDLLLEAGVTALYNHTPYEAPYDFP